MSTPSTPAWLESLLEIAAGSTEAHAPPFSMGFRYGEEDGLWEVIVFPIPVQLVGGAEDGTIVSPGFSMDLEAIREAFEQIAGMQWSVHYHLDGPEISIEGRYQGHEVVLRILAEAPDDEEPGMALDLGEETDPADVN